MKSTAPSRIAGLTQGRQLHTRIHRPTIAELFLYSAAIWNPHRIHYDLEYVTEEESYPGILITGPLMGDWLSQIVMEWLGDDGELESFSYQNRQAAYLGETLTAGATVQYVNPAQGRVQLEMHVKNEASEVIVPGTAVVCFHEEGGP